MDFNTTIEIIIKDLRDIRNIIDDFKNYPGVPLLQVELAKTKCKSVEEVISLLKILKPGLEAAGQKAELNKTGDEPLIVISDSDTEEVIPEKPVKEHEDAVQDKSGASQQALWQESVQEVKPPKSPETKKTTTQIFADKFNGTQQTILDQFGDEKDDAISEIIKSKPIKSLAEAIGINDKFLFIREIFNGNRQVYEEAISKIDNAVSFSDAKAILLSYTGESGDNEVVKQLLDLVKRKLPVDE